MSQDSTQSIFCFYLPNFVLAGRFHAVEKDTYSAIEVIGFEIFPSNIPNVIKKEAIFSNILGLVLRPKIDVITVYQGGGAQKNPQASNSMLVSKGLHWTKACQTQQDFLSQLFLNFCETKSVKLGPKYISIIFQKFVFLNL